VIANANLCKYQAHLLTTNLVYIESMSLLRACVQATSPYRKVPLQCGSLLSRGMANESTPAKKDSSEIVAPEPAREVFVADVISGAPSA
jgi:NADH dehydrogenase (ubiquinone) Fe-S protein 4